MGERSQRDERGAIMLLCLLFAVFAVALLYTTVGTVEALFFRERTQDAADRAALSSALMHARSMNLLVLINIVMAALLAILVTIKLIEALAILGTAAALGLAWPTFGASLAAVPPLQVVQRDMQASYRSLKQPIGTALEALHDVADVVKKWAPTAAAGAAESGIESDSRVAIASSFLSYRSELPVEDDAYEVLCRHAGEVPAQLVETALGAVPGIDVVMGVIGSAMGDMAEEFSEWFCGDDGKDAPTFERKEKLSYPRLDSGRRCGEQQTTEACELSRREAREAKPHPQTGVCLRGNDCSVDGPYERSVALARAQCRPDSTPRPIGYYYQQRTGRVAYTWTGGRWERGEPEYRTPALRESPWPPCGDATVRPTVAEGYELIVRLSDDVDEVQPVCTTDEVPSIVEAPEREPGAVFHRDFTEVTHILGCQKKEIIVIDVADDDGGGKGSSDRTSKRVETGVALGDEAFQIRAVVIGERKAEAIHRTIRLALWDRKAPRDPMAAVRRYGGFAVAQAEYFYDGSGGREAWMWNMSWRARLRRFRLGDEAVSKALHEACKASFVLGCGTRIRQLERFDGHFAH